LDATLVVVGVFLRGYDC